MMIIFLGGLVIDILTGKFLGVSSAGLLTLNFFLEVLGTRFQLNKAVKFFVLGCGVFLFLKF